MLGSRCNKEMSAVGYNRTDGDGRQSEHGAVDRAQMRDLETWRRLHRDRREGVQQTNTGDARRSGQYSLDCFVSISFLWAFISPRTLESGGTEAENQLPLKRSSRFQRFFPNPSWLVWGRASRYQKLPPTFPGIDSCLMVTKWDFLEMEASLWLNGKSQNVAKGWLST